MMDKKEHRDLLAEATKLLSDSADTATRDRIRLRDAVCAYLDAERARGVSTEVVQAAVVEILNRAKERAGNATDGHRAFARQLIDWCLSLTQPPAPRMRLLKPD